MIKEEIENKVVDLKRFFDTGSTKDIVFRRVHLKKLRANILSLQKEIEDALWQDLGRSAEECYLAEIAVLIQEIDLHLIKLSKWVRPESVKTPFFMFPSKSYIKYEPLGVALIIAPWNYPLQLIINPLIGAISAGCCALLRPSPGAPATASVVEKLISMTFDKSYVALVQGGREVNGYVLEEKFDIIFFTGSTHLGKVVYKAAAKHLTPVVLELGGKSPCIVDRDANITIAAKRIAWGKWLNAGQTCVAPDYIMVDHTQKEALVEAIKKEISLMYGEDTKASRYYGRIVTESAFERIVSLFKSENILMGGEYDREEKYIAPTIIDGITFESNIMKEEIFGPVLPVLTFSYIDEVIEYVNGGDKPLGLYYFGKNASKVIDNTSSGGVCINDTVLQVANHFLPFGGVGASGIGRYHGHYSFEAFSNAKAIVKSVSWFDIPFKYPPFKYFSWLKKLI